MMKKSTTKGTARAKQDDRTALRKDLAAHLSAILTNPETPTPLYNAIADELCTMSEDYCNAVSETSAYIESCLDYYQRKESKRTKGGTRQ